MSNGLSTKKLGGIFAVLIIIAAITFLFDGKTERTFRDTLVDIDTSAVTEILIYPKSLKGEEVKLFKEDGQWNVVLNESKTVITPNEKVNSLFQQLTALKPLRLVAKSENKWLDFEVEDTTGTRVIIKEGGSETLNIILGKFSFQQPRSMFTFVRLDEDEEVYQVEGFLEMTFNQKANSFRDSKLINDKPANWVKLDFDYNADSSYTMNKLGTQWHSDGVQLDSAKVDNFLNSLSNLTNTNFIDESNISNSAMKLSITATDGRVINIKAFGDTSNYVISSSMNSDSYFDGKQNNFWQKIFKGVGSLK